MWKRGNFYEIPGLRECNTRDGCLVLNGNPETYLKTVTEYKPVDFQPSAFSLAEGRFLLNSY